MQLVDSILLPGPYENLLLFSGLQNPRSRGGQHGRFWQPKPPITAPVRSRSLHAVSTLEERTSLPAAARTKSARAEPAHDVPTAGQFSLLEPRLQALKKATAKQGQGSVLARMEKRYKESNRDAQWCSYPPLVAMHPFRFMSSKFGHCNLALTISSARA